MLERLCRALQPALAFSRYRKGRLASGLNVGDCLSYALAERLRVPLLFVGNDFSRTDLAAALRTGDQRARPRNTSIERLSRSRSSSARQPMH